ncbi:2OG-Fe(II) oxygenase [Acidovorax sp. GBBC 1281]|nr:2OG-Fe(II) oxygenase [Acidovorax sp. GBBC 1281]
MTPAECGQLIQLARDTGFIAAQVRTHGGPRPMPQVRNNQRAMVESASWVALLWQRLSQVELSEIEGARAVGLPKDLRFYQYTPGQRFKMHKDGPWQEGGLTSALTFLVYLNEGFEGGATDFKTFQVQPTQGMALLFIHDTWHEGGTLVQGTKYVLRSDVLYARHPATV